MEHPVHYTKGRHKLWLSFLFILIIIILCIVLSTADCNLSHDMFESSSFTSAAVILSFPIYILFSLLLNWLSGSVVKLSGCVFLLTQLNAIFLVLYVFGVFGVWQYLYEEDEKWQLFVPFLLALGLETLWLMRKGDAPIEVNIDFQDAPSIGEVWANSCISYYLEVFKDFRERLDKFEEKQNQLDETFTIRLKKMIILIPLSCDVEGTLDKHPNIEYYGILEIHKDAQGGNVNRQYKNPVYRITSTDGQHSHMYVAIEEPNTLVAMKKLKNSEPEEIWKFQRNEFISTLCYVLSDETCCKILLYDDLQEEHPVQPLSEFLIKEVRKLVIEEVRKDCSKLKEENGGW